MFYKNLLLPVLLCLLLLTTGCNNDIFVDEPPLGEDEIGATIDGDGGETSFKIPFKGLEHISIDVMSEAERYCTYYNAAGEVVDRKSPASMVSRIVFESDFTKFEIEKDGKTLRIVSVCSTSEYESTWTIRLEYSYGVRFIYIKTLPGKPLKLMDITYPEPLKINDKEKVVTTRETFTNNGPLPQTIEVRPYLNELATIIVDPDRSGFWISAQKWTMPVPVYVNDKWSIIDKPEIMPGVRYYYERPDRFIKIPIDIPAYSKVTIITDVTYTQATGSGCMAFLNEILDRRFDVNFNVTSLYPYKHEIRIEDAK